jgi:hypothetical protein
MRHVTEEQLVASRFGFAEPDELAAIEAHLGGCDSCRQALKAIDLTLAAASQVRVPARSDGYGAEVWARLQPRLERQPSWREKVRAALSWQRLALAGGLASLILAAFVAGRAWKSPSPNAAPLPPVEAAAAPEVRQDVLLVAVEDHLDRSQMALVELVNTANAPRVDISTEQARARDLVVENRLFRQTAEETGDAAVASVLDDLERVLVEVANGPSELSRSDFEQVRQRIESQGIIFKVRVLGERVRDRETRPAADGRVQG